MDPQVREVVTGLLEEFPVEQVVDEALTDVRSEIPGFLAIDPEQMREDVSGALVLAVAVIRNGVDRGGLEGDALRSIGAMRAEQGVDIDAMLAGFRIVARTAVEAVLDLAGRHGVDAGVTRELTRAVWLHCDDAAAALATGHRGFTGSAALAPAAAKRDEAPLRRLVHGGLAPASVREASEELGLAPDTGYVVVVARAPGGTGDDQLLASYTDTGADRLVGLATTPPRDPWGVPVGFGDEVPAGDLRLSFEGALTAFEMAETFGLAEPQHPDDVRLLRAVHEQPELGDTFVERCFGHLDEPRVTAARQTLQAWFAAQGSVDLAADALFVHRNTLRYRLRTYAESAGLNLDRPEDAFTVWWALRRLDERDHPV